jgi:ribosomal protein S17E
MGTTKETHIKKCSKKDADRYVDDFKSQSEAHKDDLIQVVELISEHAITQIDHGLYGVKKS